jgi:hypothetical protein
LNWRRIESEDYHAYVRNLRAIGVPEQTVRDIVTADVMQTYRDRRRQATADAFGDFVYWDTTEPERQSELRHRQRELDSEMHQVLETLLGGGVTSPDTSAEWRNSVLDERLTFLPEGKSGQARQLLIDNSETVKQMADLMDNRSNIPDQAEREHIVQQYDALQAELYNVLTPDEYDQLQMTVTFTSENVRRRLADFHPTEEEFRQIFDVWIEQDQALARLHAAKLPLPDDRKLEGVLGRVRALMTEQRYEQFVRSWKP